MRNNIPSKIPFKPDRPDLKPIEIAPLDDGNRWLVISRSRDHHDHQGQPMLAIGTWWQPSSGEDHAMCQDKKMVFIPKRALPKLIKVLQGLVPKEPEPRGSKKQDKFGLLPSHPAERAMTKGDRLQDLMDSGIISTSALAASLYPGEDKRVAAAKVRALQAKARKRATL